MKGCNEGRRGEGRELREPESRVRIYHDASPRVWRLLTAPGHVSRGERWTDRRPEDAWAWAGGVGWGGMWLGPPRPQPAGGKAGTRVEPHSQSGAGAAVEQRLMHLSALRGASLAYRPPTPACPFADSAARGDMGQACDSFRRKSSPLLFAFSKPIAAAPRPAISKTPPCQILNAHLSQVNALKRVSAVRSRALEVGRSIPEDFRAWRPARSWKAPRSEPAFPLTKP